jgi:CspA family cold shock protein
MSTGDTLARSTDRGLRSGTVRWFNEDQGFGFIAPDDGSEDVFVHISEIAGDGHRCLADGQNVRFEVCRTATGDQARNVRIR